MICVRNYFLVSSFLHIVSSLVPHQCGTTSLLPTSRSIALNFHCIDNKEQQNTVLHQEAQKLLEEAEREILPRFTALLKRRDGIMLYGRQIEHSDLDTNCATLVSFDHTEKSSHGWDATLLLSPENKMGCTFNTPKSCFVAMNRFIVKEDCKRLFENRWAERNSKLPLQPGFMEFSLLRINEQCMPSQEEYPSYNYSTCTIWASEKAWIDWRSGEGRSSHDASRNSNVPRTPVSEWLEGPSSPIFWDGEITFMQNLSSNLM